MRHSCGMWAARGAVRVAATCVAGGVACGGEPGAGFLDAAAAAAPQLRAAMVAADPAASDPLHAAAGAPPAGPAGDANGAPLLEAAAQQALARMRVADLPAHLRAGEAEDAPQAPGSPLPGGDGGTFLADADSEPLPDALVEHSGLGDLLVVINSQAEHLRMSGEVVLCRAEDEAGDGAAEVPEVLVELALSAQDAADAMVAAVGEVAEKEDHFVPASAVSANHRVVERLSRQEGKHFSDSYITEQMGTLRRAKKTLKQAFKLNPAHAEALDRAAKRLNRAFELFDFVRTSATSALDNPVDAVRFGSGFIEHASDVLHGRSDDDSSHGGRLGEAKPAAENASEVEAPDRAQFSQSAAQPARDTRRVRFSLDA